jgi:hypothetical protein
VCHGITVVSFYHFAIGLFSNWIDSVVFLNWIDSVVFLNWFDSVVFLNWFDSVVFLNWFDSVVFVVFHFIAVFKDIPSVQEYLTYNALLLVLSVSLQHINIHLYDGVTYGF